MYAWLFLYFLFLALVIFQRCTVTYNTIAAQMYVSNSNLLQMGFRKFFQFDLNANNFP